ncbi:hypothetical protein SAMN05216286_2774 [Kosakonia oryzae]|uniref:Uncharacterized protein n=1 Tax=Kosakonia oryzae TaxID=497725 RepID=A0AA94H465_9ENTR|nr:hypothetical protein SAMN05216286_2774 [Kosakonia oryzae]
MTDFSMLCNIHKVQAKHFRNEISKKQAMG